MPLTLIKKLEFKDSLEFFSVFSQQLIPQMVMDVMGHLHGLPGLFVATTFSASLRYVSEGGKNVLVPYLRQYTNL